MDIKGTITKILTDALQNISSESLKSFKRSLSSFKVQPSYKKIPSSALDDISAEEVVDCIIRYYTINDGPRITVEVLRDINECQISQDLEQKIQREFAKKLQLGEKTPGKGLAAGKLRDATNRISSRPLRRQHQRQQYGRKNLQEFGDLSQSSDDSSQSETTKSRNVRRTLNMSTAKNKKHTSRNNGRDSMPRGQCLPDIQLVDLTETDIEYMTENHEGKAHRFACFLFKHFVSFETYQKWSKNTNFDGSRGKYALPNNLRNVILKEVRKKFPLSPKDKGQIKHALNELLRKPRRGGWPIII